MSARSAPGRLDVGEFAPGVGRFGLDRCDRLVQCRTPRLPGGVRPDDGRQFRSPGIQRGRAVAHGGRGGVRSMARIGQRAVGRGCDRSVRSPGAARPGQGPLPAHRAGCAGGAARPPHWGRRHRSRVRPTATAPLPASPSPGRGRGIRQACGRCRRRRRRRWRRGAAPGPAAPRHGGTAARSLPAGTRRHRPWRPAPSSVTAPMGPATPPARRPRRRRAPLRIPGRPGSGRERADGHPWRPRQQGGAEPIGLAADARLLRLHVPQAVRRCGGGRLFRRAAHLPSAASAAAQRASVRAVSASDTCLLQGAHIRRRRDLGGESVPLRRRVGQAAIEILAAAGPAGRAAPSPRCAWPARWRSIRSAGQPPLRRRRVRPRPRPKLVRPPRGSPASRPCASSMAARSPANRPRASSASPAKPVSRSRSRSTWSICPWVWARASSTRRLSSSSVRPAMAMRWTAAAASTA